MCLDQKGEISATALFSAEYLRLEPGSVLKAAILTRNCERIRKLLSNFVQLSRNCSAAKNIKWVFMKSTETFQTQMKSIDPSFVKIILFCKRDCIEHWQFQTFLNEKLKKNRRFSHSFSPHMLNRIGSNCTPRTINWSMGPARKGIVF